MDTEDGEPWYGASIPAGLSEPHEPTVVVGDDYGPVPVRVPADEQRHGELEGERIRDDLETIVGFSKRSRESGVRRWGRIAGRPAFSDTIEWVTDQYRDAGVADVELQEFGSTEPMWRPIDWEVRLLGNDTFGEGSEDVVLESALPADGSPPLPPEGLAAPLVHVGTASDAELHHADVDGKVAVQRVAPRKGVFFERRAVVERARNLVDRGAAAVLNVVDQPGNMHVCDFGGIEAAPVFNLGGDDGAFLTEVMSGAARAGTLSDLRLRMQLEAEERDDLTAANAVATIPGKSDENVIVNAHADAWFDGASDNADGLAVQLALARLLERSERDRPDRNFVFVSSAGHHSSGLHGPANFVRMNGDVTAKAVLVYNLEHVAQAALTAATTATVEEPKTLGISNGAPFLEDVVRRGTDRYGMSLNSVASTNVPGELGGYSPVDAPRTQMIHGGLFYHTSGDVVDTISAPGLERAARFSAFYLDEVDSAPVGDLDP